MRPSLLKSPEGHTISRRSAADGGTDARSTHHEDGERTASTLINASHQLSGGCRAVVRAECTAARLLARWYGSRGSRSSRSIRRQRPSGQDRPMECATTALPSRCVLVSGGLDFLGKGPFGAQNFLRLRRASGGSAHRTVTMDPGSETPPSIEHPRHLPGGGRHPGWGYVSHYETGQDDYISCEAP